MDSSSLSPIGTRYVQTLSPQRRCFGRMGIAQPLANLLLRESIHPFLEVGITPGTAAGCHYHRDSNDKPTDRRTKGWDVTTHDWEFSCCMRLIEQ